MAVQCGRGEVYASTMTQGARMLAAGAACLAVLLVAATFGGGSAPVDARPTTPPPASAQQAGQAAPSLVEWVPGTAAAKAYIARRKGRVRYSLLDTTTGRRWEYRATEPVKCASLIKTLLLATYLRQASVWGRPLTERDRTLLRPMIRESANDPASTLFVRLGPTAIAQTARAAGMGTVRPDPHWGLTPTTARQQVALFDHLPDLFPRRHREYAMKLLATIVPSQRWGVGQVDLPDDWLLYFKGGWGSGTGAVDHQTALLMSGERRLILSITTTGNPSHKVGKATLEGVASRLLAGLPE